jgi:REP element-mobilizing transposase RayT
MARPPRIPVWLPLDQPVIYFVTWCVHNRRPVLANDGALTAFQNAVGRLTRWRVIAAILMTDHLHALACPLGREEPVSEFSALMKRWMRQELKAMARGPRALQSADLQWEWQAGCFDRLLRSDESAQQKWEYMRENPVRAGLVSDWQAWPYHIGFHPPSEL